MRAPRYAFFGCGTGGHLAPGIALAEALRRRSPDAEIAFFPGRRAVESRFLDAAPFRRIPLPLGGRGRGALARARFAAGLAVAFARSARWIARARPRAAIGLGGYGEVAGVVAARLLGVPVYLLEQNAVPGRANRALAPVAEAVFCAWAEAGRRLPRAARARVVGNPVRRRVFEALRARAARGDAGGPSVVVAGGSQGAFGLDRAILQAIPALRGIRPMPHFTHIASPPMRAPLRTAYQEAGLPAEVAGFRPDLPELFARAQLAIARAGGTTIAELAVLGVPAILVPYPHAGDGHQSENACLAERAGFAIRLEEAEIEPEGLARLVGTLLADPPGLARMREAALRAARPDAADRIAAWVAGRRGAAPRNGGHAP